MITETTGDIWDLAYNDYWRVIPTNGSVNRSGRAVMGRGVALQAAQKFPDLAIDLASSLQREGLHVKLYVDRGLILFPVKFAWHQKASLTLIGRSCQELVDLLLSPGVKVVMPRVGCGNGKLEWPQVKPILSHYLGNLPNSIVVLEYEERLFGN